MFQRCKDSIIEGELVLRSYQRSSDELAFGGEHAAFSTSPYWKKGAANAPGICGVDGRRSPMKGKGSDGFSRCTSQ
jgi:hypothetical protein